MPPARTPFYKLIMFLGVWEQPHVSAKTVSELEALLAMLGLNSYVLSYFVTLVTYSICSKELGLHNYSAGIYQGRYSGS